jgi:hypothetical protein
MWPPGRKHGLPVCQACGLPGTKDNPLHDYVHDQGCLIYEASGTCVCSKPGYVAHRYRCPIPVEGDMAPRAPKAKGA